MAESLGELSSHANLGLPVSSRSPLRKLLVRLLWPQLKHQIDANALVVGQIAGLHREIEGYHEHASNVVNHLQGLQKRADSVAGEMDAVLERVELAKRQAFITHHEGISAIRAELAELGQAIDRFTAEREEREKDKEAMAALQQSLERRVESAFANIRIQLAQVNLFVDEVKRARPEPPSPERLAALPSAFDSLYPAFEEAFRGSEETIQDRVRVYVEDLRDAAKSAPVLDIGCGRGELLEVLRDADIDAYGIDINEEHVRSCQERGLKVELVDAVEYLSTVVPGSLGGITAIQLVEHIALGDLIGLIDRAVAALQSGGVLIFETPNPDNLTVGASTFYLDPTHERPIPPQLLAFLVGCRGFIDVEIRQLHRDELETLRKPASSKPWSEDLLPLIDALNVRFFGPQDYAIVAKKP